VSSSTAAVDPVALHGDALVIDIHTPGVGFLPRASARAYRAATRGSMPADVPLSELRSCGVDAVVAKAVGDPIVTAFRRPTKPAKAVIDQLVGIRRQAAAAGLPIATSVAELDRAVASGDPAILLGVEGADPLAGHPERAAEWAALGVRVVGLVHYVDNGLGTVQIPWNEWVPVPLPVKRPATKGLTEAGAEAVDALVAAGILVDLAHADEPTTMAVCDCVAAAGRPVISSHTGAKAVRDFARFHDDHELQAIAATGGLIGLWPFCYRGEGVTDLEDWCRHASYLIELLGVEHVGIGTDMNGVSGLMDGYRGEHDLVKLTAALVERVGLDEAGTRAVLGGNARRVLHASGAIDGDDASC
jgi:membrane dipeptidase